MILLEWLLGPHLKPFISLPSLPWWNSSPIFSFSVSSRLNHLSTRTLGRAVQYLPSSHLHIQLSHQTIDCTFQIRHRSIHWVFCFGLLERVEFIIDLLLVEVSAEFLLFYLVSFHFYFFALSFLHSLCPLRGSYLCSFFLMCLSSRNRCVLLRNVRYICARTCFHLKMVW